MCNLKVSTQASMLSYCLKIISPFAARQYLQAMCNIYSFHSSGFVVSPAAASSGHEYKPVVCEWMDQVERSSSPGDHEVHDTPQAAMMDFTTFQLWDRRGVYLTPANPPPPHTHTPPDFLSLCPHHVQRLLATCPRTSGSMF